MSVMRHNCSSPTSSTSPLQAAVKSSCPSALARPWSRAADGAVMDERADGGPTLLWDRGQGAFRSKFCRIYPVLQPPLAPCGLHGSNEH